MYVKILKNRYNHISDLDVKMNTIIVKNSINLKPTDFIKKWLNRLLPLLDA